MAKLKKLITDGLTGLRNTKPQNVTYGNGVKNPQKATAYVGKGVLRNGDTLTSIKGHFSPVPNGHLIKKDGTALKKGGKIDAFSKVKKAIKPKKEKMWMDKVKKDIFKVKPIKKK